MSTTTEPATSIVYLVEVDFGKLGTEIVGDREKTKRSVIADIISGEYPKVLKVLELEDERDCRDVTEDIAREVAEQVFADRHPISYKLKSWLHDHHPEGVMSTRGLIEDAA